MLKRARSIPCEIGQTPCFLSGKTSITAVWHSTKSTQKERPKNKELNIQKAKDRTRCARKRKAGHVITVTRRGRGQLNRERLPCQGHCRCKMTSRSSMRRKVSRGAHITQVALPSLKLSLLHVAFSGEYGSRPHSAIGTLVDKLILSQ
jgi:hypothetical protein